VELKARPGTGELKQETETNKELKQEGIKNIKENNNLMDIYSYRSCETAGSKRILL
jgi:hypothetical protein